MVLTDLPFDRCKSLHSRYDLIRRPDSAPGPGPAKQDTEKDGAEESKKYAAFLKAQERKVGPDGFLDSNKYSYTHVLKKKNDTAGKRVTNRPRAKSDTLPDNVVALTARVQQDEKDYQRRIKVVEDHMWQHKQEERELKRVEGDIIKNQRAVRHTLRDYGNAVNKKRISEEKKLNQSLERFTKMSRDHVHTMEEQTIRRIKDSANGSMDKKGTDRRLFLRMYCNAVIVCNVPELQKSKSHSHQMQAAGLAFKDQARKAELKLSDLERQYQAKRAAIELKRAEVGNLSLEFENRMRQKEDEQYKLKQELAELAITLNMESQKARVKKLDNHKETKKSTTQKIQDDLTANSNLDHKLTKSDGDIKEAMMNKRKLDADLSLTKAHLDIKKRDEQRHLTDTQIRLEDNTNIQRQLNDSAFHAGMDLRAKQIDQKVEAHNARRVNRLNTYMKGKKEKEDAQQEVWSKRFLARDHAAQRKKHEDSLKFFQKMVSKGEEQEQDLYGKVRNAEYSRQKQDQNVRRIQQTLAEVKRQNAIKIKEECMDRKRKEDELQQALIREKAELDKAHAERESSYQKLQEHRLKLKDDKHYLQEHEREHQRLLRVGARSDMQTESY